MYIIPCYENVKFVLKWKACRISFIENFNENLIWNKYIKGIINSERNSIIISHTHTHTHTHTRARARTRTYIELVDHFCTAIIVFCIERLKIWSRLDIHVREIIITVSGLVIRISVESYRQRSAVSFPPEERLVNPVSLVVSGRMDGRGSHG